MFHKNITLTIALVVVIFSCDSPTVTKEKSFEGPDGDCVPIVVFKGLKDSYFVDEQITGTVSISDSTWLYGQGLNYEWIRIEPHIKIDNQEVNVIDGKAQINAIAKSSIYHDDGSSGKILVDITVPSPKHGDITLHDAWQYRIKNN